MRRAREVENQGSSPALLDMLNVKHSPLQYSLQYIGTLLQGFGRRLMLIWVPSMCESLAEWFRTSPDQVGMLRRFLLFVAAQLHKRHCQYYTAWPWRLYVLADHRVERGLYLQVADEFMRASPCCLPEGLARRLQALLKALGYCADQSNQLLNDRPFIEFLLHLARLATCTIADVEWRHGRNRKKTQEHGQSRWATIAAAAVNEEEVCGLFLYVMSPNSACTRSTDERGPSATSGSGRFCLRGEAHNFS